MPPPPKPWETAAGNAQASAAATGSSTALSPAAPLPATPTPGVSRQVGMRSTVGSGYGGMGGYGGGMYGSSSSMLGGGYGMGSMGMGMGGYGMGGMGSMYGGMGGMYGGMGGMYGGMGGMMGGMGGMGMMGMQGEGVDQRGQMVFMLVGRCMEMFGMFTQVLQMVFGSVVQFMGSYIGLSQQYRQLNEGADERIVDEEGNVYDRDGSYVSSSRSKRRQSSKRNGRPPAPQVQSIRSLLWSLLKRLVVIAVVYFIATRTYRLCRRTSEWIVQATDPALAPQPQQMLTDGPSGMQGARGMTSSTTW